MEKKDEDKYFYTGKQKDWDVVSHPLYKRYWNMRQNALQRNHEVQGLLLKEPNKMDHIMASAATQSMIAVMDQVLTQLKNYLLKD
mgnify:CR=1 FL=1